MKEIVIEKKDAGQRMDKYLRKYMPSATSGFLYKMLRKKNIILNGKKAEGNEILAPEDHICIYFSEDTLKKMMSKNMDCYETAYEKLPHIDVLYENEDIMFVNKPAGVLSQMDQADSISINEWLSGYCMVKNKNLDVTTYRPSIVNRLDRNTSGIVMAAKTYAGSRFLTDMIKQHHLKKIYLAVVEGIPEGAGELKGFLYKDEKQNKVKIYSTIEEIDKNLQKDAHEIHTKYHVKERKDGYSLLEIELITGKTHQIRAHFASMGFPLAGDIKYGGKPYHKKKVQQLHAWKVQFPPMDGESFGMSDQCIECPLPDHFW